MMKANKNLKRYARFAAMVTALLIVGTAAAAIASVRPRSDTYTVYSDDGYYSETTYYLNEKDFARQTEARSTEGGKYSTASGELTPTDENEEFVLGISKNVWVREVTDEAGNVTESKLLKKAEIEELYEQTAKIESAARSADAEDPDFGLSLIGLDNTKIHLLTLDLSVLYNKDTHYYFAGATASWAEQLVWFWQTDIAAEEEFEDYLGLSWGGDGAFKADIISCSGNYYHGETIYDFSRKYSDSYAGFVWQFNEKEGILGDELEHFNASISMEKINPSVQNKETSIKATYIHTYGVIEGNVSFSVDSDGKLEASANLSASEKQWQIELDVPGLEY